MVTALSSKPSTSSHTHWTWPYSQAAFPLKLERRNSLQSRTDKQRARVNLNFLTANRRIQGAALFTKCWRVKLDVRLRGEAVRGVTSHIRGEDEACIGQLLPSQQEDWTVILDIYEGYFLLHSLKKSFQKELQFFFWWPSAGMLSLRRDKNCLLFLLIKEGKESYCSRETRIFRLD